MRLMLLCLVGLDVLELGLYAAVLWRLRRPVAVLILVLQLAVIGDLFAMRTNGWSYLVLLTGLYRSFNLCRVAFGISPVAYLHRKGFQSSLSLMAAQSVVLAGWAASEYYHGTGYQGWLLLATIQLSLAIVMLVTTFRQQRKTTPHLATTALANRELPSITVCIPARNETESLEHCLRSLIVSDYPKLEILVLDDNSQDKTSAIIKGFAHDGVRFLKGRVPPKNWLAKNWAYQQLADQANGDLLVFCGVDIRFSTSALRELVTITLEKQKQMIGVMPTNELLAGGRLRALLVQPVRYAWELCLPRRLFNRPPVLSSCWIITRQLLKQNGSFEGVKSSISPESHFAREAITTDSYSFVRDAGRIGISSGKTFQDQLETAVRTRYPQLHRRPELVLGVSLVETFIMLASLPMAIAGFWIGRPLVASLSLAAACIGAIVFVRIVSITYGQSSWLTWLAVPFAIGLDIGIRHYAMWKYEFSTVVWKGRDIRFLMMYVEQQLPLPSADTHDGK